MKAIIAFLLLFVSSLRAQTTSDISSVIPGRWTLTKHTITKSNKSVDTYDGKMIANYEFSKNGTYVYKITEGTFNAVEKGKWKVTENGKKLRLYNNTTDSPNSIIADHDLIIMTIKGEHFITYSFSDSVYAPETDYYKKQK